MFSKRRFRRRNKPSSQNLLESAEQQQETPFIPPVQTKLNIGKPGDAYEVEADKTADAVVAKTNSSETIQKMGAEEEEVQAKPLAAGLTTFVQKQEAPQEEEPVQAMAEEEAEEPIQKQEEEEVQAKSNDANIARNGLSSQLNIAKGGGAPMDKSTKYEMEQAFGNDFSNVNIHTDAKAKRMNKQLNAQAFTHGNDIYFNDGKYNPKTKKGKHLLAHELTHTIQQKGSESLRLQQEPSHSPSNPQPTQATPMQISLNMAMPTVPEPNYSRTANRLGAWEKADFSFTPSPSYTCDSINVNGVENSFVTNIGVSLNNRRFEFYVAKHIKDNMDLAATRDERRIWSQILNRILRHARHHFTIYETTTQAVATQIRADIMTLPTQNQPMQIAKQVLEDHVRDVLTYWMAKLEYELWRATCNWETTDYPRLFNGIRDVHANLRPNCGSAPGIPPRPILPTIVRRRRNP